MPLPLQPTLDFVTGLPKAELHVHLEGTLEPDLKLRLAERNSVDIGQSTVEEIRATYRFTDLSSFLAVYYPAMDVLRTEDDFFELAHAYLLRAAANGVKHAEMFFDPQAHTSRGVPFETVVRATTAPRPPRPTSASTPTSSCASCATTRPRAPPRPSRRPCRSRT
ncbi:hypothetical protein NKG05_02655 [Oerskovia sp. M15]